MPVQVAPVTVQEVSERLTLVGTVEPRTRSVVASEIKGYVERYPVDEGDSVRKGDLLAKLKTDTLELELQQKRAALREHEARYEQAKRQLARTEPLYQEGLVSLKQYQDEQAEETALREKLAQLELEIAQIKNNIGKSRIEAPFAGQIIRIFTGIGQWLTEGGPVVEMVDLDHVRVQIPVPERLIARLKRGDLVPVTFDALPNVKKQGKVILIVAQADEAARTFPVKIEFENKEHEVKTGMMARVSVPVGQPTLAKVVPKDALVIRGGEYSVFVVEEDSARPVPVQIGVMIENLAEIRGAVEEGQQVVIRGNERLRPGQPVRIIN